MKRIKLKKNDIDVFIDTIYPVGSIYMNLNPTNPSELFGGTWEQIPFRYLIGCGMIEKNNYNGYGSVDSQVGTWGIEAGMTFGEIMHQLTVNEMPSHSHSLNGAYTGQNVNVSNTGNEWAQTTNAWSTGGYIGETGGNQPHNNMPPSLSVYMWKRVS